MKHFKYSSKGITLISLAMTVIILMIISGMLIYNSTSNVKLQVYYKMKNDIDVLTEQIDAYYIKYGDIPAKVKYNNIDNINKANQIGPNDKPNEYYVIDLQALENISLNYGYDFKPGENDENYYKDKFDLYIINKQSHKIYYPKGVNLDGEIYYTYGNEDDISENIVITSINDMVGKRFKCEKKLTVGNKKITIPAKAVVSKIPGEHGDTQEGIDGGIVIYIIPDNVDIERENFWTEDKKKFNSSGELVTVGEGENSDGIPDVQQEYDQFVWVPVENAVLDLSDNPATEDVETNYYSTLNNTQIKNAVRNAKDKDGKQIYPMAIKIDATNYIGVLYEFNDSTTENKVEITPSTNWRPQYTSGWYHREPDTVSDKDGNTTCLNQINGILDYNTSDENYISDITKFGERLQKEYNEMVKSVKDNGGFWIGRYEISNMRDDTTEANNQVQVKTVKGANNSSDSTSLITSVTWYRMYAEQSIYSNKSNLNKTTSSMIWGSQWDQVMIWMKDVPSKEEYRGGTYTDSSGEQVYSGMYYITNSLGMGNYGVPSVIKNGETITIDDGEPDKKLYATGTSENAKVKNIYDLAGNDAEWSL